MATQKLQDKELKQGNDIGAPPPSSETSPAHEFSFSSSLQPSFTSIPNYNTLIYNKNTTTILNLPSAGDIFSLGHQLHLQPPSQPSVAAPCSRNVFAGSFSRPLEHTRSGLSLNHHPIDHRDSACEYEESIKTRTLSFFFGHRKWRKEGDSGDKEEDNKKKKKGFHLSWWIAKKYASMMEIFSWEKHELLRRPYRKRRDGWWKKKGQLSAPTSMRTSPSNSGRLSATTLTFASSADSAVEELHGGIQAAIAHCKSSNTNKDEKCKCGRVK
ncbi:response to steroid hormone stimulus [Musa troglodytarum]|uniref:Response to steroid hormone stimulus n=1 Tax=Musa troglodytarum TaxID=320322 RepID=A0A9E7GTY9_9LILI|nr:response to steroid hormone stimulus [Musa troglodytarum]